MSPALVLAGALAGIAVAVASSSLVIVRHLRGRGSRRHDAQPGLPWAVGAFLPMASVLERAVAPLLPKAHHVRLGRELEALGFAPAISPARWEAVRVLHGCVLAAGVWLLPGGAPVWLLAMTALAGHAAGGIWLARTRAAQVRSIVRELPAWLDLMTVCVEAGATLTSGIRLILAQAPDSALSSYFDRVLREIRSGRPRVQAFTHVADIYAVESLGTLAAALAAAEGSGVSLGQMLRTQAEQRTAERFSRAEKLAMQAPVKMLGPLILCIFPCTFIVIAVPIAVRLREVIGA